MAEPREEFLIQLRRLCKKASLIDVDVIENKDTLASLSQRAGKLYVNYVRILTPDKIMALPKDIEIFRKLQYLNSRLALSQKPSYKVAWETE